MKGCNSGLLILVFALVSSITRYIFCQHCPVTVQFNLEHLQRRLFGSGYAVTTIVNYSLHKCARTCFRHGWCRSFNYRREFGFCEMNSVNASEASDHNLLVDADWDYYDIDIWLQLIAPSCTANTCPKTHRCLHGGRGPWCIETEDTAPDSCLDEWYQFNNTCYFKSDFTNIGQKPCEQRGADLAKVWNEEVNTFLLEMLLGLHSDFANYVHVVNGPDGRDVRFPDGIWTNVGISYTNDYAYFICEKPSVYGTEEDRMGE